MIKSSPSKFISSRRGLGWINISSKYNCVMVNRSQLNVDLRWSDIPKIISLSKTSSNIFVSTEYQRISDHPLFWLRSEPYNFLCDEADIDLLLYSHQWPSLFWFCKMNTLPVLFFLSHKHFQNCITFVPPQKKISAENLMINLHGPNLYHLYL